MADDTILIAVSPGETRLVRLRAGQVVAVEHDRAGSRDPVGDLHHGRVSALAPALAGAFVTLGNGVGAFLPAADSDPGRAAGAAVPPVNAILRQGQALAVRVSRAALNGKGLRVTAMLDPSDRAEAGLQAAPSLVRREVEPALRWLRDAPAPARIATDDPATHARLRAQAPPKLAAIMTLRPAPLLDDGIEEQLDALAGAEAALPGGARLLVAITPAATTIDVDTGGAEATRAARLARGAVNAEAILAVGRHIVARNLSGKIVIDLAGLPSSRPVRLGLAAALAAALEADPLHAQVLGFSRLGLLEVQRPRVRPALEEVLGCAIRFAAPSELTLGLAALRRALAAVAASPGLAPRLRAHPTVIAALPDAALADFATRTGRRLAVLADGGLSRGQAMIEDARGVVDSTD